MLGFFILFSWLAFLAFNNTRRQKARLALPGQVDEEFRQALSKNDHSALINYYKLVLNRTLPAKDEQLVRINLAYALNGLKEYEASLEELDKVVLKHLVPQQIVLWLNNRAYTLLQLHRPEDALDNLKDASELLRGEEEFAADPTLAACVSGTRGMALFKTGQLEQAEQALQQALRLEEQGAKQNFSGSTITLDASRTAERWYWLSEISRARGEQVQLKLRLQKAACYPLTEYGQKSIQALRQTIKQVVKPTEQ